MLSGTMSLKTAVLALACSLVVGAAGGAVVQGWRLGAELSAADAKHSDYVAKAEENTRKAVEDARAEEGRKRDGVQKAADETQKKLDAAVADAAASRDAGEQLRARIAQLTARLRDASLKSASANAGAPAVSTEDLLADVQRRLDEAADGIAGFADIAHAAGLGCQRSYEALTPKSGLGLKP